MNGNGVKRGGLSRADVAEAREQAGEAAAAFVAEQLGLELAAPRAVHELDFTDGIGVSATVTEVSRSLAPRTASTLPVRSVAKRRSHRT